MPTLGLLREFLSPHPGNSSSVQYRRRDVHRSDAAESPITFVSYQCLTDVSLSDYCQH